jgi:hypothetical protein
LALLPSVDQNNLLTLNRLTAHNNLLTINRGIHFRKLFCLNETVGVFVGHTRRNRRHNKFEMDCVTMKLVERETGLPLDLVVLINSFLYERLTDENFKQANRSVV